MMNVNDPKIVSLRDNVKAAQQEFDLAVTFHETWKPTAYNEGLHERMGTSYATNAFNVVRVALRREMLLALMRLWDKPSGTVSLEHIAKTLDGHVIDALAADRAARIGFPEAKKQMKEDLGQRAVEAIALIKKYSRGGSHYAVRESLQQTRHERLAHRQTKAASATGATATDEEIESFYRDISEIIRLLLSLVEGLANDPAETGQVFRHYAAHFWAGVSGERTEGHPNYRAPPRVTAAK